MTSPSSYVASLSFFCLLLFLLPAQHGASSSYASYKLGSRQVFFKTSGRSQEASTAVPPAANCSSLATGPGNNKLPVVHRQSPCSPLQGLQSLTAADVLRRDASLIRRQFSSQSSVVAALGASPAVTIIPTNLHVPRKLPGALLHSVLVSYGTPKQQFSLYLDSGSIGASLLRCKPCNDCDPALDTSRSSTFTHILCGSPDCPTNNCSVGSVCPLHDEFSVMRGTFAEDVLTLAPFMSIHDFLFFCMDEDETLEREAGTLNLSMDHNSLPSQLSSSGRIAPAATFSYCLPRSPSSLGFLSLGGDDYYNVTVHAPLVSSANPELASMYFIDVVGMSLGGEDLPIPAGTFGNNDTNLNVGITSTMLTTDVYTLLRDSFRKQMSQYNHLSVPGIDGYFDTCFNFTGLDELMMPLVEFKFSNGDSLVIERDQMLYYDDPTAAPFTMACLAFSSLDVGDAFSAFSAVIGTYSLMSTQVVYDVAGGKVGFIPGSC